MGIASTENDCAEVTERLSSILPGKNLHDLAREYSVTVRKEGRLNKGWVGQTLERVAGLNAGNAQRRDGIDFELKSTSLVKRPSGWEPKETLKITQLNPQGVLTEDFSSSALWEKMSSLILVGCVHQSPTICTALCVSYFAVSDKELYNALLSFWQEIKLILSLGEIADYTSQGSSGGYLQLRPTGTGKTLSVCPVTGRRFQSLAFYATKRLVRHALYPLLP